MENKYTVTYKVAPRGAQYVYQEIKGEYEKGDVHDSSGGHMWYVLSDGSGNEISYGFESKKGVPIGNVTDVDNAAYKNTSNVFGAQIIRDDLTGNSLTREEIDTSSGMKKTTIYSDWYEEKDLQACLWLPPEERTSIREGGSLIKVDINSSSKPQTNGRQVALSPGMSVTAEIKTDRRRVINYVLSPLQQYKDESFRER
jgi:hypothetical protein